MAAEVNQPQPVGLLPTHLVGDALRRGLGLAKVG
jgi:hypothetical protein